MDALQLLRDDHRKVKELFRQFEEAEDASTRKAIADEAIAELMVHAQLEEEIFYPAMEREGMRDIVDHAEEEHHAAENLMNELFDLDARDSQLQPKFRVLIETVNEHVTEEESQMFPRAAEIGMERLERIGDQLQELKMRIMSASPTERRRPQRRKAKARAAATAARETSAAARAATGTRGNGRTKASGSTRSKSRSGGGSKAARSQKDKDRSRSSRAKASTAGRSTASRSSGSTSSRSSGGSRGSTGRQNGGGLASMSKQELYERAQKADIDGRSGMSKDQLVRALQKTS